MKATHLAAAIDSIATGRGGIWIEPSTKEEAQHHEYKIAIDVDEIVSTIGQAMLLWNPVFGEFVSELHNEFEKEENKFMLIVDALDECDEEALPTLLLSWKTSERDMGMLSLHVAIPIEKCLRTFQES